MRLTCKYKCPKSKREECLTQKTEGYVMMEVERDLQMIHCCPEDRGRDYKPRNVALGVGKARKQILPGVPGGSTTPLTPWF